MDDDGWMDPGPGHILALSLENDESVQLSFGYQGDVFPYHYGEEQEFFQQEFSLMFARHQRVPRRFAVAAVLFAIVHIPDSLNP